MPFTSWWEEQIHPWASALSKGWKGTAWCSLCVIDHAIPQSSWQNMFSFSLSLRHLATGSLQCMETRREKKHLKKFTPWLYERFYQEHQMSTESEYHSRAWMKWERTWSLWAASGGTAKTYKVLIFFLPFPVFAVLVFKEAQREMCNFFFYLVMQRGQA